MGTPVVILPSGGIAVTESPNGIPLTEATNGRGFAVTFVASGGLPVTGIVSGPSIQLSASSVAENASIATVVGTLSVVGGTGTYTFTLTDSAGGKFVLGGTNNSSLRTAALLDYETASSHVIAVSATNGVTPITAKNFTIIVTDILETVYLLSMGSGSFALTGSNMEIIEMEAGAYVGPGDVAGYGTAYAYWGLRAYTAAYATSLGPLADLVRDDAATMTLNCLATGAHDATTLNAWMTGHTAKVSKLYNQAGTGTGRDLLGFNAARSPVLTMSGVGLGSVPCMYFDYNINSHFMISTSNSTVLAQPFTYSAITRFNTFVGNTAIFSDGTFGVQAYSNAAAKMVPYAGSFATPSNYSMVADGSWGSLQMVYSAAASSVNSSNTGFNSSATPTTVGTSINTNGFDGTAKLTLGSMTVGGSNYMNGYVFEFMVLPSAVSAANQALMAANQRALIPAPAFSLTLTGSAPSTATGSTSINYGTLSYGADNTRVIVAPQWTYGGSGQTITGITVGGVALTQVPGAFNNGGGAAGNSAIDVWVSSAPLAGSSGAVVVTASSNFPWYSACGVYTLISANPNVSAVALGNTPSGTTVSAAITVPASGGAIALAAGANGVALSSFTNVTVDATPSPSGRAYVYGHTTATGAITPTATFGSDTLSLTLVAWSGT